MRSKTKVFVFERRSFLRTGILMVDPTPTVPLIL